MSSGFLQIIDSRTNAQYRIPIQRNVISAVDLKSIKVPPSGTDPADQVSGGLRVYDPGLQNTAVVQTGISFSDHDRAILLFRGYTLEQLWHSDFEDMLHLLVWSSYPTPLQRKELSQKLAAHMLDIPESVHSAIKSLPSSTSPLPLLMTGLSAYLACVPETIPASTDANMYQGNAANVDQAILRTVAAIHAPTVEKTFYENLFLMAGLVDPSTRQPDPVKLTCYRRFAMLNADHGMALTVFSALVTASSLPDPVSCLISALAAASGPLHFGATEAAQRTLREIHSPRNVPAFLHQVKRGERKLFGYGHRAYKGIDPRVRPIQAILADLQGLSDHPHPDPLLAIARRIEQLAASDEYFVQRGLYPNADFYGNFVFTGIGFEPEMIPPAMVAQRIIGIMAHWREYMEPYSIFTTNQKWLIILAAAIASTFSPLSANIYYPALNSIAADLHVSTSQVNLTITTYMVSFLFFTQDESNQSLMPTEKLSYVKASPQPSWDPLQTKPGDDRPLRALQSCGSSGTVALASAVAADVITSAERGTYMGITSLGNIVAPSLGPLLGGVISQYLGWQAIFWFLALASGVFFVPLMWFFPETCRAIVGNGLTIPNPLSTLRLLFQLPTGLLLLANGVVFASYYSITAGIPSQFKAIYGFDDLHIGLGFIPAGVGSLTSATFNGILLDWNYQRIRKNAGLSTSRSHKQDHTDFPVERARLQIGLPMTILSAVMVFLYGVLVDHSPPLWIALILVFAVSLCITAAYNVMNILLVDLYYDTPATAMAANNLVRCFLGAGSTALVHPMIQRWGNTGTYVIVAATMVAVCPLLVMVYCWGLKWRRRGVM
ncbi:hypothetical protein FE257_010965 [Aspergillus nanangensis]|uniref:Citrate synthase n=1 Tax=Aspergillus nanangensis TaxID=2582783 RepID=A0AAD4GZG6_ASPNN|nr:hypothetical protein FE257_010965 [Aspergillus nanangensis]